MVRPRGGAGERQEGGRLEDEDLPLTAADPDLEAAATDDPSFTDEPLNTDVAGAVQDGEPYAPPTDPVVTAGRFGETQVLGGGEATAWDAGIAPERSTLDGRMSDDAIEIAIREQLRLDAATTDLEPQVRVQVREGIASLRGAVPSLEDAENVEAVTAGVAGVIEVEENLTVEGL